MLQDRQEPEVPQNDDMTSIVSRKRKKQDQLVCQDSDDSSKENYNTCNGAQKRVKVREHDAKPEQHAIPDSLQCDESKTEAKLVPAEQKSSTTSQN